MAINFKKVWEGLKLVPKTTSTADSKGEFEVLDSTGKASYHNGSSLSPVVTEAHAATLTNKSIDADTNTITNIENSDIKAGAMIDATKIASGQVDNTEFLYLDGVTSSIQDQLDSKTSSTLTDAHIFVGNASNIATDVPVSGDLTLDNTGNFQIVAGTIINADVNATANIDASKLGTGIVSNTEFNHLDGVTSPIQTQLDARVTGPASAIDNHIVRFDGTTGKLAQDGTPVVLSDAGALSGLTGITTSGTTAVSTLEVQDQMTESVTTDSATGSGVTVTPSTPIVVFTNTGLTSISMISSPVSGKSVTLINQTGHSITINNKTGATAANQIETGTGAAISLNDESSILLKYEPNDLKWLVIGGTGSGTGSSGINYVTNGTAETGTTGWETYADAAAAIPADGTGGSPNVTLAASSSSPLRGTQSFLFTKDAANRQGQGVSYAFTIDSADQASILRVSMDYEVSSNYADTVSGSLINSDMQVFVYDVTNAQLIYCDTQNIAATTTRGHLMTTFQTNSNSTSYRLIFHVASTSALAYTVKYDNVVVGPQTLIKGSVDTDWLSYTPTLTNFGAVSINTAKYRRVGDSIEITGEISLTAAVTGQLNVSLPSGLTVDTTKINNGAGIGHVFGTAEARDTDTATEYVGNAIFLNTTAFRFYSVGASANVWAAAVPFTWATGDSIHYSVTIPVAGYSSNVQLSEDGGNRIVAASVYRTTDQTISATGQQTVIFDTKDTNGDSTGSFNTTTGAFTAPEAGRYQFNVSLRINGYTSAEQLTVRLIKDGTSIKIFNTTATTTPDINVDISFLDPNGTKGAVYTVTVASVADTSYTVVGGNQNSRFNVFKLASPQTLAGSETVAVRAVQSSGQSLTSGADTTVVWDTAKTYDTHNALVTSTGIFTAPTSGYYSVTAQVASVYGIASSFQLHIQKNAVTVRTGVLITNTTSAAYIPTVADTVYLTKGDNLRIVANQNSGVLQTLRTTATQNVVTIELVK